MADRTRPIRIEVCVTKQESNLIRHKMAQLGTRNMSTYFHKMDIDGYIIKVDYTQQKKRPQPSVGLPPISINMPPHQQHRAFLQGRYFRTEIQAI